MSKNNSALGINSSIRTLLQYLLTAIRILIGWHFLYEGLAKLFSPDWSAGAYLLESQWILSGLFHNLAVNETALQIIDFLNIWGLIFIGLCLFLGLFTRIASLAGAFLMLLYYIANPPFIGYLGEVTGEGQYLIVNKLLIEMVVLLLFTFLPARFSFGINRLIKRLKTSIKTAEHQNSDSEVGNGTNVRRRELIKDLISFPFLGGFVYASLKKKQWESFEERQLISEPTRVDAVSGASPKAITYADLANLTGQVPKGKLGGYEISRIFSGGNLISSFVHSRDLIYVSSLVQSYFTDEKVLETIKLCEYCGMDTIILRVDINTLRIIEKYRKRGGKMKWISQSKITDDDIRSDIDASVENGAIAAYIHGGVCDSYVQRGNLDHILKAIDYIKSTGMLAGIGAHDLRVIIESEKDGADPDFYMKTLNSGNYWTAGPKLITRPDWTPDPKTIVEPEFGKDEHDNIWSVTPQQTIEFMKEVKKPWIAYKVLGAGAIHPKDGFRYAFENGADFCCVGMFDFQIVENANIAINLLKENIARIRPWYS